MGMSNEEICYRLQAMATMCTFQDAVGHDLSPKEIKLYNQAKDEAIETMRKYQKIVQIMERTVDDGTSMYDTLQEIEEVIEDGND